MAEPETQKNPPSYGTVSDPKPAPYPASVPSYQAQTSPAPPYYEGQQTTKVAVVHQPLLAAPTVRQPSREPTVSIVAIVVAAVSFTVLASLGIFWSIPFAIIGIILGIVSMEKGKAGDMRKCRIHANISFCCSVVAWISMIVGAGIITGIVFAIIAATVPSDSS